jgi:hypothetical protein
MGNRSTIASVYMISWTDIENSQKEVCKKVKVNWTPVDRNFMIAINDSLFTTTQPINGLRHPRQQTIDGWYLWSGKEIPQEQNNFFVPIHIDHLIENRPLVLKYLGLPEGWRFQINDNGYEDIWFDEKILL